MKAKQLLPITLLIIAFIISFAFLIKDEIEINKMREKVKKQEREIEKGEDDRRLLKINYEYKVKQLNK